MSNVIDPPPVADRADADASAAADAFERLVREFLDPLDSEAVARIGEFRPSPETLAMMEDLSSRSGAGELSPADRGRHMGLSKAARTLASISALAREAAGGR